MFPKRTPILALLIPVALIGCTDDPADVTIDGDEDGHTFAYTQPSQAPDIETISLRGEFNEWGETAMAQEPDGSWKATIDLDDGTYEYKFYINEVWPPDMCNDPMWGDPASDHWIDAGATGCVPDGHGGQNAFVMIGENPGLAFTHSATDPVYVSGAGGRLSVRFRAHQGEVRSATVTAGEDSFPMHLQLQNGLQEVWRASLPEGTSEYAFTVETTDSTATFGPYAVPADVFTAVPWVGGSVGYQIFPERFWNGDPTNDFAALETDVVNYMHPDTWNVVPELTEDWDGEMGESHCCHQYFGGDLQGIIDRLDHLETLGVSLLYLNPIFTSGSAHGYDTYDYLEVAPNFGDTIVLRQLLDQAGARGMRVMWDFVPNHVGVGFWAFQEAVTVGEDSPYWDWFNFKVPSSQVRVGNGNHYEAWWDYGTLPRLETRNVDVFDHLIDVTRHWTEFGFEGIRVDVPGEIRNRSEFYGAFREAAKAIDPDVYLIGEVWERDPSWLQGDQFDALMNYALGESVVESYARGHRTGPSAAQAMAALYADYPEAAAAMLFNLISSHDTARLLTKMGGGSLRDTPGSDALARQRLASAMLYALPGVPVTFQGDECAFLGTSGDREEHRYPFQWDACDAAMAAHYQQLAELRAAVDGLRSPAIRAHESVGSLLSFYRGEPGTGEVLVVLNNASASASLTLPEGTWTDAASGAALSGSAEVAAFGWRYLVRS